MGIPSSLVDLGTKWPAREHVKNDSQRKAWEEIRSLSAMLKTVYSHPEWKDSAKPDDRSVDDLVAREGNLIDRLEIAVREAGMAGLGEHPVIREYLTIFSTYPFKIY